MPPPPAMGYGGGGGYGAYGGGMPPPGQPYYGERPDVSDVQQGQLIDASDTFLASRAAGGRQRMGNGNVGATAGRAGVTQGARGGAALTDKYGNLI